MSIVVTGATGHLGRLTVQALLRRGVPADQIVATGRRVETLDDLAAQGVHVRLADFTDPSPCATRSPAPTRCCGSPPARSGSGCPSTPTPSTPRRTPASVCSPTRASPRRTAPR